MALVRCAECQAQVSDKAASCVKCGYPLKPAKEPQEPPALTIGCCAKCGSSDTGDIVAEASARRSETMTEMLGLRMGAFAGGGRYYCRRCGHRWRYNG